jgi:hypothetical protein
MANLWTTPDVHPVWQTPLGKNVRYLKDHVDTLETPAPKGFRVSRITTTSPTTATWTKLIADATQFNYNACYDIALGKFTVPITGQWLLFAELEFNAHATGQRLHAFCPYGSPGANYYIIGRDNGGGATYPWGPVPISAVSVLNAGDQLEYDVYQDSGTSLPVNFSLFSCTWGAVLVAKS